jgi:hypothetical protein
LLTFFDFFIQLLILPLSALAKNHPAFSDTRHAHAINLRQQVQLIGQFLNALSKASYLNATLLASSLICAAASSLLTFSYLFQLELSLSFLFSISFLPRPAQVLAWTSVIGPLLFSGCPAPWPAPCFSPLRVQGLPEIRVFLPGPLAFLLSLLPLSNRFLQFTGA